MSSIQDIKKPSPRLHSKSTMAAHHTTQHMTTKQYFTKRVCLDVDKSMIAGVIAVIGSFVTGNIVGYTSPAIPNINANPNPFHFTWEQQSWYISSLFLTGIPGSLLTGAIMDTFGRKIGLIVCTVPMVIGWLVVICSSDLITMFAGRIILGFFKSPILGIVITYNAEIASPAIRGTLVSFHEIFMNAGICMCYIIGTFLTWRWLAVVCIAVVSVWLCLLIFIPESPRWLMSQQKKEAAEFSLRWLRQKNEDIKKEMQDIEHGLSSMRIIPWTDFIKQPLITSLLICFITFIFQMFSGITVIHMYTVIIFQATKTKLNPNYQTIISGMFMVFGATMGTILIDRFQRRSVMAVSGVLMGIGMAAIGVYFKLMELYSNFTTNYLVWLPVLAMIICVLGFASGLGPIPYIIVNELFPTNARGKANGMCLVVQSLSAFLCNVFFIDIKNAIHDYGEFWVYSAVCLTASLFAIFAVPNTKGKSLEAIQEDAMKRNGKTIVTKL